MLIERPSACSLRRLEVEPGTARHIAERGDHHVRDARERDNGIDVFVGGYANRAPWTGNELRVVRHQITQAIARDGNRMRSTYFP